MRKYTDRIARTKATSACQCRPENRLLLRSYLARLLCICGGLVDPYTQGLGGSDEHAA